VLGRPPAHARLAPLQRRCPLLGRGEPLERSGRISAPEGGEPEDRMVLRQERRPVLVRQVERPRRVFACELEPAAVHGDDGDGEVILGDLDAVLDSDVVRASSVLRCELPPPRPKLDPSEPPQGTGAPWLVSLAPLSVLAFEQGAGLVPLRGRGERVHQCLRRLLHQTLAPERAREVSGQLGRSSGAAASPTNQCRIACTARARCRRGSSSSRRSASSSAASACSNPDL
jgi:hypothetical protein